MIRKIFKNILYFFLIPFSSKCDGAVILMYHSIASNSVFSTVQPKIFERQIRYLSKKRQVISLSDLIERIKNGNDIKNTAVITFDDGYKDNLTNAYPVLEKHKIPATIFISTGFIGKNFRTSDGTEIAALNEDEIRKIRETGLIECMPHTVTHRRLDLISLGEAKAEIENSRKDIENITGKEARIFCYPKGAFDSSISSYLKESGWKGAVSVKPGLNYHDSDLFALKRNSIDSETTFLEFKIKISNASMHYESIKNFFRNGA